MVPNLHRPDIDSANAPTFVQLRSSAGFFFIMVRVEGGDLSGLEKRRGVCTYFADLTSF